MVLPRKSVFLTLSIVSILIPVSLTLIFYIFGFVPLQRRYVQNGLRDRALAIAALSEKPLSRALIGRDDVSLLNALQAIMKIGDVSSAYVLGPDGRVLSHAMPGEWGKSFHDAVSVNAVRAGCPLFQETANGKDWVFSAPVTSSATLCIGFSRQRQAAVMLSERKSFIYASLIILIAAVLPLLIGAHVLAARRSARLLSALATMVFLPGTTRITFDGDDEFSRIAARVNELLSRAVVDPAAGKTVSGGVSPLLAEVASLQGNVVMIAGDDNRILYAGSAARHFFSLPSGNVTGSHLLDAVKEPAVLKLLKESADTPGTWREGIAAGTKVRALAIKSSTGIAGTIILLHQ